MLDSELHEKISTFEKKYWMTMPDVYIPALREIFSEMLLRLEKPLRKETE